MYGGFGQWFTGGALTNEKRTLSVDDTYALRVALTGATVSLDIAEIDMGTIEIRGPSGNSAEVTSGSALKVDASATVQPISATALPLPAGAATSAAQTTGNASVASAAASLASIYSQLVSGLTVSFATPQAVTGTFFQATQPVSIASMPSTPVTGTFWQTTQPISATSLPLPTLAATSTLQSTINTTLGSPFQAGGSIGNTSFGISGTLPAFASTPTVNLGTLNGAATLSGQAAISATLGSPFQAGGSIGNTSFGISGTLPAFAATPAFTISGTLPAFAATPTVDLGSLNGAATSLKQDSIIALLASVPVTGSFYQATQPVSAAALPLPSNAAKETGGNLDILAAAPVADQAILLLLLGEIKKLRQAFEDWSGMSPRFDPNNYMSVTTRQ